MKNQNRKSSSSSDQRTHRFWLSSSLSRGENEWTNWGGFSPLGGLETKARVCRRVRCRSQKGRAKRIETYLGGLARPLWSMGPLFTIHASTTLPRFLFRPHCPPEQHMAALYSSLSLQQDKQVQALSTLSRISITRRRVHARPKCSKRFSFGSNLFSFPSRMKGYYGILWEIWIQTMSRSIWRHIIFLLFFHVYYSYFLYSIVFYHKMYQLTKFIYYPIIGE